jgi:hypothetical protein
MSAKKIVVYYWTLCNCKVIRNYLRTKKGGIKGNPKKYNTGNI